MPALPLDEAGKYVAAAYLAFLALLLVYVAIMAARLQRLDRELGELAELAEPRADRDPGTPGREAEEIPGGSSDAGAEDDARGEAERKVFERERSSRQEVV
jgi:hypothetical protein